MPKIKLIQAVITRPFIYDFQHQHNSYSEIVNNSCQSAYDHLDNHKKDTSVISLEQSMFFLIISNLKFLT